MWMRCSFPHSLDSLRSSLSKAKYPIHLHQDYLNWYSLNSRSCAFVKCLNFIDDPRSLFWWLVTVRRPRCVITSFSTKWTGISIVEAKYYTFIFALVWRTQTFIHSTSRNFIFFTRRKKSPKWCEIQHVTHVTCDICCMSYSISRILAWIAKIWTKYLD